MTQDKPTIALVTGASRGLGKNTALAVAKKGVGVIVTYLNGEAEAKSVVSEIEAMGNNWRSQTSPYKSAFPVKAI
jgi:NAD(P)-dependent dehydrogenase (short-subunit alcohol dehydrogenase family)